MLDCSIFKLIMVIVLMWVLDGECIVIVIDVVLQFVISVWGFDGILEQEFEIIDLFVIKLLWNFSNIVLLVILFDKNGVMVVVYDLVCSV